MATEKEEKRKPETEESGQDNFDKAAYLSLTLQEIIILKRKLHEPPGKTGKDLTDVDLFAMDRVLIKLSKQMLTIIRSLLNILRFPKRYKQTFLDLVEEAEYISTVSRKVLLLLSELEVEKRFESTRWNKWFMLKDVSFSLLMFSLDIKESLYPVLNLVDSNITPKITKTVHRALDEMGFLQFALLKLTESVPMLDEAHISFQRDFDEPSYSAFRRYWNFPPWRESDIEMKFHEDLNAKLKTIHTMQEGKLVIGSEQCWIYPSWEENSEEEADIEMKSYEDLNAGLKTIHRMQEGELVIRSEQGTSTERSSEEYEISNFDGDWNETDNLLKLLEDDLSLKLKSDLQRREKILVATSEKETSTGRPYEEHKESTSSYSLNENFPESDELVAKPTDAKQDLESRRTWFFRKPGLEQHIPLWFALLTSDDDELEDYCEKSDRQCGFHKHHQGQIKSEPKTPAEHKESTSSYSLNENFPESDELVSKLTDAKQDLESLRTWFLSEMRETGLKQKQLSFRTKRNRTSLLEEPCADDKLEDHCEKSDRQCGIDEHHQEPETPAEHKSITQDQRLSELFDAYNSCVALKADLTRVLECYDAFRKSERISGAKSRHEAEIKEIASVAIEKNCLEMSRKDTETNEVTMAEYSLQETSEEIAVQSQPCSQLENIQASSLQNSLLSAQVHLSLLSKTLQHKEVTPTAMDEQMDTELNLQSETSKYKYFLETLENTLQFALKCVKPSTNTEVTAEEDHSNTAISVDLRYQVQPQTDKESGVCSNTAKKNLAELKSFEEFGNEDNNSFASVYSTTSSLTFNVPLVDSNNDVTQPTSIQPSTNKVPEKVAAYKDSPLRDWLSKDSSLTAVNVLSTYSKEKATQTQSGNQQEPPPPIVSKRWQASTCFSSTGGTLGTPHSDVRLCVPGNAVNPGGYVDVHAAVSTDLELARQLVKMSPEEYIVAPIPEYWAGETFCFEKPVCIIIPHCLQSNVDHEMVRVYRVSKLADGRVYFVRIRPLRDVNNSEPKETKIQNQWNNSETEDCYENITWRLPSEHQNSRAEENLLDISSENSNYICSERRHDENLIEWDDGASFILSSDGKLYVSTTHFSAYVCTYCGYSREPPTLTILACGLRQRLEDGRQAADVQVLIMDSRIYFPDCEYEYASDRPKLAMCTFKLPSQELHDSNICVRLRIIGYNQDMWRHCRDSLNEFGFPEEQVLSLHGLVSCDNNKCTNKDTKPKTIFWMLENTDGQDPVICRCAVDICHVPDGQPPKWHCTKIQRIPLSMKEPIQSRENENIIKLDDLLLLGTTDLEYIAQRLKIRESYIKELRQKYNGDDYRVQLSRKCLSKPDCSKVLKAFFPDLESGPNISSQSRRDIFKNKNSVQQLLEIENSSMLSSDEEPSKQANQVAMSLEEAKRNYIVSGTRNQLNTFRGNSTNGSSMSGSNTSSLRFASNGNFFNSDLVSGVDRVPALPLANNPFNGPAIQQLNNMSLIALQRQLQPLNVDPEEAGCLEQALSEIRFHTHDQFPDLNLHSAQS